MMSAQTRILSISVLLSGLILVSIAWADEGAEFTESAVEDAVPTVNQGASPEAGGHEEVETPNPVTGDLDFQYPDVFAEVPYVYPLFRMRPTPRP